MNSQRSEDAPGENIALTYTDSYLRRLFRSLDVDNDGVIPLGEFARGLRSVNHDIPKKAIDRVVKRADENCDGVISYPEFKKFVLERERGAQWLFQRYVNVAIPPRKLKAIRTDSTDGEYEEEYSCYPPPLGMVIISLLEIGTFLYDNLSRGYGYIDGPAATLFIYNPHRRIEVWRFVTYMFVHIGAFHLIVNLAVQLLLGLPLEMVHGWWRVLTVYISGVLAGSLATSISDPNVYLAGASGGVYAIIAAHVATIIMNWNEMQFASVQLVIFLILAISDVGSAVYNRYVLNMNEQIGYVAHLAGAVAGLLVGIYILRNLQVRPWERKMWWAALVIYIVLMVAGIAVNIFVPSYFPMQSV